MHPFLGYTATPAVFCIPSPTDAVQFNEVITFTDADTELCRLLTPIDNAAVGNEVAFVLELDSSDRAVPVGSSADLIIRDDDSKYHSSRTSICPCREDSSDLHLLYIQVWRSCLRAPVTMCPSLMAL